jgi:hypothetical protein
MWGSGEGWAGRLVERIVAWRVKRVWVAGRGPDTALTASTWRGTHVSTSRVAGRRYAGMRVLGGGHVEAEAALAAAVALAVKGPGAAASQQAPPSPAPAGAAGKGPQPVVGGTGASETSTAPAVPQHSEGGAGPAAAAGGAPPGEEAPAGGGAAGQVWPSLAAVPAVAAAVPASVATAVTSATAAAAGSSAVWRKKPATLAALARLQASATVPPVLTIQPSHRPRAPTPAHPLFAQPPAAARRGAHADLFPGLCVFTTWRTEPVLTAGPCAVATGRRRSTRDSRPP